MKRLIMNKAAKLLFITDFVAFDSGRLKCKPNAD